MTGQEAGPPSRSTSLPCAEEGRKEEAVPVVPLVSRNPHQCLHGCHDIDGARSPSQINPGIRSTTQKMVFPAELLIRTGVDSLPASLLNLHVVLLSCHACPLSSLVPTRAVATPRLLSIFLAPTLSVYAPFGGSPTLSQQVLIPLGLIQQLPLAALPWWTFCSILQHPSSPPPFVAAALLGG